MGPSCRRRSCSGCSMRRRGSSCRGGATPWILPRRPSWGGSAAACAWDPSSPAGTRSSACGQHRPDPRPWDPPAHGNPRPWDPYPWEPLRFLLRPHPGPPWGIPCDLPPAATPGTPSTWEPYLGHPHGTPTHGIHLGPTHGNPPGTAPPHETPPFPGHTVPPDPHVPPVPLPVLV